MNKTSKSSKQNLSFMSSTQNPISSPKKQFPSVSLSKHMQQYKAYRSIDNRKRFPQIDKNTTFNISPEERSILMMRNCQMPSIHNANQMGQGQEMMAQGRVQKIQVKILRSLLTSKKEQEWRLYMSKSELMQQKSHQFQEIQEYLLKTISKLMDKSWLRRDHFMGEQQNVHNQTQQQRVNFQQKDRKHNSSFSNLILDTTTNRQNRNGYQPSLRVLKDQANISKDNSMTQFGNSGLNRTANNFNNYSKDKTFLIQKIQSKFQQEMNKLTFQRSLLQKKMQLYQTRIHQLQSRLVQFNISIQANQQQGLQGGAISQSQRNKPKRSHDNNSDQLLLSNLINQNKYKSQAQFKKIQNDTLIKELNIIKEFSFKLKGQNQKLKNYIETLEIQCKECRQFKKYKQLWLMQCEEMIGWKDMYRERKDDNQRLANKIKILKQKNKQLLHSFNFSMVVNPDQEQDKQQLQNIIKGFQQWLRVISVPRVNCVSIDPKSLLQEQAIKEHQYMPDPENVNYKLLKPNFFIFFEAYEKTIMMEKNILNTRPLQPTFFVKIRAILDSMYNHFNSFGCYKYWTSFPQFVIGFLEKYEINFTTLKMQPRKKPMSSQQKLTFLMNLFNKKLSHTWECEMFRSFILEQYTLDEIYFFLDCRNDLNGGPVLTHGLGTMDPVNYVKIQRALSTTQKKLVPYQNHIIERVKTIIKSRKKQKSGQSFIDRHFVLKLLLEVYGLQKHKSQRIFEASFKSKNSKKTTVSYSDFFGFMTKNFQFLSTIDVCELYRQTYALSSGKITFKSVHYICSSKGLFIPLIWTKRLNMNVLDKSLNNDMTLLDLQNSARKINSYLSQLGVEQVSKLDSDLNYFLRQLDWYRNNRQVFYFKLQQIKMKIIKSNCLLDWHSSTYTPNEILSSQQIREGILQLHGLIHQSDNSSNLLGKKRQQKQKALKQLTRNFKIRIQQSMQEFKRVDDEQLKKLKQQVAHQIKIRQLRLKGQQTEANYQENFTSIQKPMVGNSVLNVKNILVGQRTRKISNIAASKSSAVKFQENMKRSSLLQKIQQNQF